jgi:hypothetical protein
MTTAPTSDTYASVSASNASKTQAEQGTPRWLALANASDVAFDEAAQLALTESLFADILANIDNIDFSQVERASPSSERILALLRASKAFRQRIRGWVQLRDFISFYLAKRGHDVKIEMNGLL